MKENNYSFKWSDIGDLELGRPNLGNNTHVAVYRLMQYTMRSVLSNEFGAEKASKIFYDSGYVAGKEFCTNMLDESLDLFGFISNLQEVLKTLNVGILRVEKADADNMNFVVTVSEDLDCSGLPITNETVCDYDEGFIAGIFDKYTGKSFKVKDNVG